MFTLFALVVLSGCVAHSEPPSEVQQLTLDVQRARARVVESQLVMDDVFIDVRTYHTTPEWKYPRHTPVARSLPD